MNVNGERLFILKKDIVELVVILGERSFDFWFFDKFVNFCLFDV